MTELPSLRTQPNASLLGQRIADWFTSATSTATGEFIHPLIGQMRQHDVALVIHDLERLSDRAAVALQPVASSPDDRMMMRAVVAWATTLLAQVHLAAGDGLCSECQKSWPCRTVHALTTALRPQAHRRASGGGPDREKSD
jgi:hypothetical protein